MSWFLAIALWLSAYYAIRRWTRLNFEETWLAAGLAGCAEALVITGLLGLSGHLRPTSTLTLTALAIAFHIGAVVLGHAPVRPASPEGLWRVYWPKPLWPAILFAAAVFIFQLHLAAGLQTADRPDQRRGTG